MDRWINKVAVVTGASSGIGMAITKALVKKQIKVVGLARRIESMEKIKNELKNEKGAFYPIKCDLSKEEDILRAFQWIEKNFKTVDILINNAGAATHDFLIESPTENMKHVVNVNLIAPSVCTRETVRMMRANNISGHIININSIAGLRVPPYPKMSFSMYSPTKFALKAVSRIVELELEYVKSNTKITSIFPGLVKTEMPPSEFLEEMPFIDAEDISDGVIFALSTAPSVQIKELTITPVPGFVR